MASQPPPPNNTSDPLKSGAIFSIKNLDVLKSHTPNKKPKGTCVSLSESMIKEKFDKVVRSTPLPTWLQSQKMPYFNSTSSSSLPPSGSSSDLNQERRMAVQSRFDSVVRATPTPTWMASSPQTMSMRMSDPLAAAVGVQVPPRSFPVSSGFNPTSVTLQRDRQAVPVPTYGEYQQASAISTPSIPRLDAPLRKTPSMVSVPAVTDEVDIVVQNSSSINSSPLHVIQQNNTTMPSDQTEMDTEGMSVGLSADGETGADSSGSAIQNSANTEVHEKEGNDAVVTEPTPAAPSRPNDSVAKKVKQVTITKVMAGHRKRRFENAPQDSLLSALSSPTASSSSTVSQTSTGSAATASQPVRGLKPKAAKAPAASSTSVQEWCEDIVTKTVTPIATTTEVGGDRVVSSKEKGSGSKRVTRARSADSTQPAFRNTQKDKVVSNTSSGNVGSTSLVAKKPRGKMIALAQDLQNSEKGMPFDNTAKSKTSKAAKSGTRPSSTTTILSSATAMEGARDEAVKRKPRVYRHHLQHMAEEAAKGKEDDIFDKLDFIPQNSKVVVSEKDVEAKTPAKIFEHHALYHLQNSCKKSGTLDSVLANIKSPIDSPYVSSETTDKELKHGNPGKKSSMWQASYVHKLSLKMKDKKGLKKKDSGHEITTMMDKNVGIKEFSSNEGNVIGKFNASKSKVCIRVLPDDDDDDDDNGDMSVDSLASPDDDDDGY